MAKHFKLQPIQSIEGKPIQVFDEDSKQPRDGNLIDLLKLFIRAFPRDRMTMDNVTHGSRLMNQLMAVNDELVIEEAEHDWVKKLLNEDNIGPKIFGFNLVNVLEALDQFERRINDT